MLRPYGISRQRAVLASSLAAEDLRIGGPRLPIPDLIARALANDEQEFRAAPEIDWRRNREARHAGEGVVLVFLGDVRQILQRRDAILTARAGQGNLRHLARIDRREQARIEVARRLERLARAPQDEEHAAAALLGENPLLLELVARPDDIVAGRQAVLQRDVLFRQRVDAVGEQ